MCRIRDDSNVIFVQNKLINLFSQVSQVAKILGAFAQSCMFSGGEKLSLLLKHFSIWNLVITKIFSSSAGHVFLLTKVIIPYVGKCLGNRQFYILSVGVQIS